MLYGQLPKYLINRLQRVKNTTAGYVYGRYAKMLDVINLNWLLIEENIEMDTVKLAHKSLKTNWPNYLKSALIERKKNLWSSDLVPIIKQGDEYAIQQWATVYNKLPKDFKEINDFKAFSRKLKGSYKDKALARVLNLYWVLSLIFFFMSNYAIAVYCCNLLFSLFNLDSVLYLSLRPLILLNFFSNGQWIYILYLLISHNYPL